MALAGGIFDWFCGVVVVCVACGGGRVNVFLVGWWHVWLFGGWGMLLFWCSTRVVALCCRGGGGLSFGLFRRSCFLPGHDLLLFD